MLGTLARNTGAPRMHTRQLWTPRTILSTTSILSRAALGAAGGLVAAGTYYGDKAQQWANERLEGLKKFQDYLPEFKTLQMKNRQPKDGATDLQHNDEHEHEAKQPQQRQDERLIKLTRKLLEVKNLLVSIDHNDRFQLPSIVVVGSQSSGKSSLLEAIVGREFLPKGNNLVTRRPIEITLVNEPAGTEEYAELPRQGLKRVTDFQRVQSVIADLNMSVSEEQCVSDEPIDLRIHSPHVPDLTLIDLPGYIAVNNSRQPEQLKQKIVALCRKYLQAPNIILAVCASDVDLANSEALNESRQLDPGGERTLGVLTKCDLVPAERVVQMINNHDYPLKMGYFSVVCKSQEAESQFLQENQQTLAAVRQRLGVDILTRALTRILEQGMLASLGGVARKVQQEMQDVRYQFKVQYDDRQISAESYVTELIDTFKQRFRKQMSQYGRAEMQRDIQAQLDQQVLDSCDQLFYADQVLTSDIQSTPAEQLDHDRQLRECLDIAHAALSKSGVGRISTEAVVAKLTGMVSDILAQEPFTHHPSTQTSIRLLADDLITSKFGNAVDQVENTIKPYKYATEYTEQEWRVGMKRSIDALERRVAEHQRQLEAMKVQCGRRKLRSAMQYIEAASKSPQQLDGKELPFSSQVLEQAREASVMQQRIAELQHRIQTLKPGWFFASACAYRKQYQHHTECHCPEPYLMHITDRMAHTAAMFVQVELVHEFAYQLPRDIDNKLYYRAADQDSRDSQVVALAEENEQVRKHLRMQHKKDQLERAAEQLNYLLAQQSRDGGSGAR